MNDATRMLVGSQSRDDFKRRHKDLDCTFYACDLDLCWVSKNPPSILAVLDYKKDGDRITFSEVVAYCDLIEQDVKVLIVQGDCETGQFCIQQFVAGDYRPYPPKVELAYMADTESWEDFGDFQREFRRTEEARKRSIQKGFSQ
jgi:hypothetical protein